MAYGRQRHNNDNDEFYMTVSKTTNTYHIIQPKLRSCACVYVPMEILEPNGLCVRVGWTQSSSCNGATIWSGSFRFVCSVVDGVCVRTIDFFQCSSEEKLLLFCFHCSSFATHKYGYAVAKNVDGFSALRLPMGFQMCWDFFPHALREILNSPATCQCFFTVPLYAWT